VKAAMGLHRHQTDAIISGMKDITLNFNECYTTIVIYIKKFEVATALYKGSEDIHYITVPWTPMSINQFNESGLFLGSSN